MNRPWDETFRVEEIREYIRKLRDKDLLQRGCPLYDDTRSYAGKATAQRVSDSA
jgi:hypothetical protein